jgi:hypothetical protein
MVGHRERDMQVPIKFGIVAAEQAAVHRELVTTGFVTTCSRRPQLPLFGIS